MRPTELLSQDHQVILQMLKVIEGMAKRIGSGQDVEIEHLDGVVEFIRAFADKCHHAKEENLLFPAMEAAGIPKDGG
ncbi:MAG: hemerythrin domain-containing protein, partial [Deltaproteobacteria bacterium]|nr:hemerythrin domain-containing protein [Deltaproteobacteria bacterium]